MVIGCKTCARFHWALYPPSPLMVDGCYDDFKFDFKRDG